MVCLRTCVRIVNKRVVAVVVVVVVVVVNGNDEAWFVHRYGAPLASKDGEWSSAYSTGHSK